LKKKKSMISPTKASFSRLMLCLLLTAWFTSASAQTDTGGGMGGTGIKDKPATVEPAAAEQPLAKSCKNENSIGLYQLRVNKDNKVKEQGYVCTGQTLKTKSAETIEIHLRSGENIKILENSQVHFEKPGEQ
jgi:hypothetical protein